MGCVPTVTATSMPRPGRFAGQRVGVLFHYGQEEFSGVVVRDDAEAPFVTIIRLDDGRHILATECQYRPTQGGV